MGRQGALIDLAWSFDKLLAEIDALRANVAALEEAGDGLADWIARDNVAPYGFEVLARWREVRGK